MSHRSGRHFLQIPGPTNVPDRVLRAIDAPDDRPPRAGLRRSSGWRCSRACARSSAPTARWSIYPSSGTGAWEAALVNTLSPGDRVLAFETGHFATLWRAMAERLGLEVEWVPGDWRHGVDPERVADALARATRAIRAVMVVHNETSTGVTSRVAEVRAAIDAAGSDALLLVDTISSLGSIDYRHDEWGVDVTVGCSQKGLMLPAGLGFNAVSEKALAAAEERAAAALVLGLGADHRGQPRPASGPTRRATNLLYGLREALAMLREEGLRERLRAPPRGTPRPPAPPCAAWGLEVLCARRARALRPR